MLSFSSQIILMYEYNSLQYSKIICPLHCPAAIITEFWIISPALQLGKMLISMQEGTNFLPPLQYCPLFLCISLSRKADFPTNHNGGLFCLVLFICFFVVACLFSYSMIFLCTTCRMVATRTFTGIYQIFSRKFHISDCNVQCNQSQSTCVTYGKNNSTSVVRFLFLFCFFCMQAAGRPCVLQYAFARFHISCYNVLHDVHITLGRLVESIQKTEQRTKFHLMAAIVQY